MKRFKFLLFVAVLVEFAALAYAGNDDGVAAYTRGDYARAYKEFKPLAEQGNATAQSCLGWMYDKGQGVPQDFAEACKWYRKAAEQGDADGQYFLGVMFKDGRGVSKDDAEAVKWFRKAAEQDYPEAQHCLGLAYVGGFGVLQDFVQAHMWLNLAAARGNVKAHEMRDELLDLMTPAQIAEAQRLAREWKPKGRD
jgi:hypothetical protein